MTLKKEGGKTFSNIYSVSAVSSNNYSMDEGSTNFTHNRTKTRLSRIIATCVSLSKRVYKPKGSNYCIKTW